jgi:transcriptional regulator GlxA family with amidase domain
MDKSSTSLEIESRLFLQPLHELTTKIAYFRRLERLWHLIETDYANPSLSLEQAAMAGRANKNHLNVLLRQTTLFTFHQLLIRYRLWRAISMMEDKNYSFLEIALETGFGSLNTFERNFRTILGTTPRQFKAAASSAPESTEHRPSKAAGTGGFR